MAEIKFTKKSLREQEQKLDQLESYLPTLQLKKKLLQFEITQSHMRIEELFKMYQHERNEIEEFCSLFSQTESIVQDYSQIEHVAKSYENIAGVEIPKFEDIKFKDDTYTLFDTPLWTDISLKKMKKAINTKQNMNVEEEKKRALLHELRDVSIRVNLFEKILIPRTLSNIKKIKIFLGDQELAAVAQAKVAKTKILEKKKINK